MTPTASLNHLFAVIAPKLGDRLLFWGCKGFERGTSKLIHELAAQEGLPAQQIGAISGPSFALEVAQLQPTALVVASQNLSLARQLANNISEPTLRCYHSDDIAGVEIGGALKNVIAVAAGIADGLGFGANTRAALITRGLAEMSRLAASLGAKSSTMMGLAGMGDLLLTATDDQSRNRRFGLALGAGMSVEAAEQSVGQVVEGKYAAYGALQRAIANHVDMPITKMVVAILEGEVSPKAAISSLMTRPIKAE
jgi:glycerol-3-phosphate dehydrogenase (NAD(P)+)